MQAIGHFDFGINLRPVDFEGWLDKRSASDAQSLAFWIEYWQACYAHLIRGRQTTSVIFFNFDRLCRQPAAALESLGRHLKLGDLQPLLSMAPDIRPPRPHAVDDADIPESLLKTVKGTYEQLEQLSLQHIQV
jgi:hypothetical protein